SRRRHTRFSRDWSSDVCSSDLCHQRRCLQLNLETPPLVAAVSILFTTTYVCITAYFVHQQGMRLAQARREIETEQAKAARLARKIGRASCRERAQIAVRDETVK